MPEKKIPDNHSTLSRAFSGVTGKTGRKVYEVTLESKMPDVVCFCRDETYAEEIMQE